jgi:hypothetical protein
MKGLHEDEQCTSYIIQLVSGTNRSVNFNTKQKNVPCPCSQRKTRMNTATHPNINRSFSFETVERFKLEVHQLQQREDSPCLNAHYVLNIFIHPFYRAAWLRK